MMNAKVYRVDALRSGMRAGIHEFAVTQAVQTRGTSLPVDRSKDVPSQKVRIEVRLERFQPAEVAFRYPPPGSAGNFSQVLPHLVLRRAGWPWERTCETKPRDCRYEDGASAASRTKEGKGDGENKHGDLEDDRSPEPRLIREVEPEIHGVSTRSAVNSMFLHPTSTTTGCSHPAQFHAMALRQWEGVFVEPFGYPTPIPLLTQWP
jgi:hypothetical protein